MTITKSVFAIVLTTVLATGAVLYFSSQSADLQCVARSTMISRGQDWIPTSMETHALLQSDSIVFVDFGYH